MFFFWGGRGGFNQYENQIQFAVYMKLMKQTSAMTLTQNLSANMLHEIYKFASHNIHK